MGTFAGAMRTAEAEMRASGATSVTLGSKMKAAAESTGLMSKAAGVLKGALATMGVMAAVAAVAAIIQKLVEWREHCEQVRKATTGLEDAIGAADAAYSGYSGSIEGATKSLEANRVTAEKALVSQAQLADRMGETWGDIGTNAAMVDMYASEIERLGKLENLTAEDQARLSVAVEGFNKLTDAGIEILDAEQGTLNRTSDAIMGVAAAYKEEARAAAAKEMLIDLNKQQLQDEIALKSAKDELARAEAEYQYQLENFPDSAASYGQAVNSAQQKVDEMERALASANKTEQDLYDVLSEAPQHFKTLEDALASCGLSIEDLGEVTEDELEDMRKDFDGSLTSIEKSCGKHGKKIPEALASGISSTTSKTTAAAGTMGKRIQAAVALLPESLKGTGIESVVKMAAGMASRTSDVGTSAAGLFKSAKDGVGGMPSSYTGTGETSGKNLASGLSSKKGAVSTSASTLLSTAVSGISSITASYKDKGTAAGSSFSGGISSVSAYGSGRTLANSGKSGLESVSAWSAGSNFSYGFADGLLAAVATAAARARQLAYSALDSMRYALGIASPSKETMKVGEFFVEGAVVGMSRMEGELARQTNRLNGIMELEPTVGEYRYGAQGAYHRGDSIMQGNVTMNVTVNVSASSASEGRAVGTGLADALYEELSREMGSRLWPVSYSAA